MKEPFYCYKRNMLLLIFLGLNFWMKYGRMYKDDYKVDRGLGVLAPFFMIGNGLSDMMEGIQIIFFDVIAFMVVTYKLAINISSLKRVGNYSQIFFLAILAMWYLFSFQALFT